MSAATAASSASDGRTPVPFAVLAAGGLIPFVAGALASWFAPEADRSVVLYWLTGYAMVILAFVGALHWGIAMMDGGATERALWLGALWSVLPALIAWAALLLPSAVGLRLMAGVFVVQFYMDRKIAQRHPVPQWFVPLRLRLTLVVVAALLAATLA